MHASHLQNERKAGCALPSCVHRAQHRYHCSQILTHGYSYKSVSTLQCPLVSRKHCNILSCLKVQVLMLYTMVLYAVAYIHGFCLSC